MDIIIKRYYSGLSPYMADLIGKGKHIPTVPMPGWVSVGSWVRRVVLVSYWKVLSDTESVAQKLRQITR